MTKIVINKCFGGFGLSDEATVAYLLESGIPYASKVNDYGDNTFWLDPETMFSEYDLDRDDPVLVAVVEKLGDKANSLYSELKIVEIPDDVEWQLGEYDGIEWVAEKHRTWS